MPQASGNSIMAEPGDLERLPEATVERPKRGRISVIWIIPILAAVVAIGIAIQRIRSEGPTITIIFTAAEGIEAGKTLVKYKDVTIGRVTQVELTNDFAKVRVTAKIAKHAAGLMVEDAKFWVVQPTVSLSGVSGLSTLLSGNYIGFGPGKATESQDNFTGLDVAPVITEERGGQFALKANDLGSLEIGSPVYYRRLPVGQVIAYELAPDGNTVQIRIFVKAPYDTYVYPETRFWNASGVDVSVGADGVNVRTESLVALLIGGLAFGAPVTLLGLPAGEVTSIGLEFDEAKANVRPRVMITFFPERLMAYASTKADARGFAPVLKDEQKRRAFLRRLIEDRGLRGQLKSGSLLTGQLYVAFDYYPKASKVKVNLSQ